MNIPDEAIEAAARAFMSETDPWDDWHTLPEVFRSVYRANATRILEVAAPLIAAQALESAAEIRADGLYGEPLHAWLYERAAFLRRSA